MKICLMCCLSHLEAHGLDELDRVDELTVIPVPCSGKIDIRYLVKAFETGADGVAIVTCQDGECRYLEGNLRARKRGEAVAALLDEAGLGAERLCVMSVNGGGVRDVSRRLAEFTHRLAGMRAVH